MWDNFRKDDILLADSLMCAWTEIATLKQRGGEYVCHLNSANCSADFGSGKIISIDDHIVEWPKPKKPQAIDRKTYNAFPEFLTRNPMVRTIAIDRNAILFVVLGILVTIAVYRCVWAVPVPITTPGIDPTNNIAEQAIRFVVLDRKVTQGSRSEAGQRWLERIWTAIATCTQHGQSVFEFLHKSVLASFRGDQPPSLLSDTS